MSKCESLYVVKVRRGVFDPSALAHLDHLIAALKARGIYVAIELHSSRKFRADDGFVNLVIGPESSGDDARAAFLRVSA